MNRRTFLKNAIVSTVVLPTLSSIVCGSEKSVGVHIPQVPTSNSSSKQVDLSRLLRCIAEVESGNNDAKVGRHGERSRYQIKARVWYDYTVHNFNECHGQRAISIAWEHLHWLNNHLPHDLFSEREFRQYPLAVAWNGGLATWQSRLSTRVANYATRVTNLYDDPTFQPAA